MSTTAIRAITTAVLMLFVGAMGPAFAGSATIGGVSINLPTPKGFCELSSNDSSEKSMLTTIGAIVKSAGNILLSMSADCQQLAAWDAHQRKAIDDLAQYHTNIDGQTETFKNEAIQQTCNDVRAQGGEISDNCRSKRQHNED